MLMMFAYDTQIYLSLYFQNQADRDYKTVFEVLKTDWPEIFFS